MITPKNATTLGAEIVCGAANLQASARAADYVLGFGRTLWVPDVLVNAGAVIEGAMTALSAAPPTREAIDHAIDAIGPRTRAFLEGAKDRGLSTMEALFAAVRHPKAGRGPVYV